jgi:hypothetical protein
MGALVDLIYCIMSARVRIDASKKYEDDYLFSSSMSNLVVASY